MEEVYSLEQVKVIVAVVHTWQALASRASRFRCCLIIGPNPVESRYFFTACAGLSQQQKRSRGGQGDSRDLHGVWPKQKIKCCANNTYVRTLNLHTESDQIAHLFPLLLSSFVCFLWSLRLSIDERITLMKSIPLFNSAW